MQQVVRGAEGGVPTQFETIEDVSYNVPGTQSFKSNTKSPAH
jgi:hypothetical protein